MWDSSEPTECIEIYDNYDGNLSPQQGGVTFWVCEDPNAICDVAEDGEHGICLAVLSPDMLYYVAMYGAECERSVYDNQPPDKLPSYWDCVW